MSDKHPTPRLDTDGLPVADPDFEAKRRAQFQAYLAASADLADDLDEPVLHATDPGWWRALSTRVPGLLVHSAGGACPFQSEGTLHGHDYYFRYRHGYAALQVGNIDDYGAHLYSAGVEYGHELDGVLSREEFCDLMLRLVPQLVRAPFLWEFQGVQVHVEDVANPEPFNRADRPEPAPKDLRFTATETPQTYRAWGTTPGEAYDRLHQTSEYLLTHGWSEDKQREHNRLRAIDPTPLNADTRVFPDPAPDFEVHP